MAKRACQRLLQGADMATRSLAVGADYSQIRELHS